ncbi:glutaredoxin family protein [Pseudanabaena sp. FACHB-1277]|uniref:Glutaredoxin family protein n=1 Tax=Pseudanabaena cinerea FACHB-1277 TaxID=2949581 RepID=A0A926Z6S7_9CYAN|nr:glutaredoxin family protein [Pseudanabaena cinerea]MBD2150995.1 glutaredoxin family protein [Pseudanabaena cinerea FACHB-1277]
MKLILYSKQGCCLCEGLLTKLQQVKNVEFELETRDITTNSEWFDRYQYEIPVLCLVNAQQQEQELPRLSPRSPIEKLEKLLKNAA